MDTLSENEPLRPGSTVRRIVNGQVVTLQVVQDQGGKIFVTDPANPKRVDQMDRNDIAPMTPEEEEEAAKDKNLNPNGAPKLKPHGIVPDNTIESRPFRMDRPRPFQLSNPTGAPRTTHCTCQTCGDNKPDDGALHCAKCRNRGGARQTSHESRLAAILEGNFEGEPPPEIQTDWYQAYMAVRAHLLVLSKAVIDGNTSAASQFALQSSGVIQQATSL